MATADTNTKNRYYDSILADANLKPTTAEALQAKFDAVTRAEYDRQRTDLQNTTKQYYDQLYDSQLTAMDTIRQANAQAVATGASRGVQAANELAAILGMQSEAATGAAELANQATTIAQDETAAILQNALDAETQAAEINQAIASILTQAGSVDVEQQNANAALAQVLETVRQTNPELAAELQTQFNQKTSGLAEDAAKYLSNAQILTKPEIAGNILTENPGSYNNLGAQNAHSTNIANITAYFDRIGVDSSTVKEDLDAIRTAVHANRGKYSNTFAAYGDAIGKYVEAKRLEAIERYSK